MHQALDDTIAAIATAPGTAGLAVLRVSGARALEIADAVFRGSASLGSAAPQTLHHGWAVWPDATEARIDEVVAGVFRAPRSYTREDLVELSCHGGPALAQRLLDALLAAGARLARPGEFTLRAFLSGRLDLAQAEAVADLIQAETEMARELARSQLRGSLSRRLAEIEEAIVDAAAETEARVDFAEDVGGVEVPAHVVAAIASADASLAALLERSDYARAVREGIRIPIVGRPNAGKSSLFNALLGEERAIVTEIPGTTRDRVSEALEIAGVRITLSDTAGVRETEDPVESIGVGRTVSAIEESRIALWVIDSVLPFSAEDRRLATALAGRRVLVALNKSDLANARPAPELATEVRAHLNGSPYRVVPVSARSGQGLESLRDGLGELLGAAPRSDRPAEPGHDPAVEPGHDPPGATPSGFALAVANPRHVEALRRARAALGRAASAAESGAPGEIVALELRDSLEAVGEVTGRAASEELLDRIFARFCIGK
jgi:tRNA modification GTPase